MARPWPVLPDVGSMIVPPGLSSPARSAASIIGRPIRSLTDPPGLSISSLASSRGWRSAGPRSRVSRLIRTSGVSPTRSRIDSAYCIAAEYTGAHPPPTGAYRADPAQASRSSRPGRRRSQVRRRRSRRRSLGRIDGPRLERLHRRSEDRGKRLAHPAGDVELLARPGHWQRRRHAPDPASSRADVTGSTRDAIRRPR